MASKSKQVRNQNANGDFVVSSVDTHGDDIARQLAVMNSGLAEDERMSEEALRSYLSWFAAVLRAQNQSLATAEDKYVSEQADDPAVRTRRKDATAELVAATIRVRGRIESLRGAEGLATYGLEQVTPRQSIALAEHVGMAIKLLRQRPVQIDDPLLGMFDSAEVANGLEAVLAPLLQSLQDTQREKRELEATLIERNRALSDWLLRYRGVAGALTGIYLLAGAEELAQRIRPTVRRVTGQEPPPAPGEGPEQGDEGAGEGGASEASNGDGAVVASNGADDTVRNVAAAATSPAASPSVAQAPSK